MQESIAQDSFRKFTSPFSAPGTDPVTYFIIKDQVSASNVPVLHQGFHDIVAPHSATSVQVHPGAHVFGSIAAAVPLKFSILSDSNFNARYT